MPTDSEKSQLLNCQKRFSSENSWRFFHKGVKWDFQRFFQASSHFREKFKSSRELERIKLFERLFQFNIQPRVGCKEKRYGLYINGKRGNGSLEFLIFDVTFILIAIKTRAKNSLWNPPQKNNLTLKKNLYEILRVIRETFSRNFSSCSAQRTSLFASFFSPACCLLYMKIVSWS